MTISTTPGAVIGSETDVLPPKRPIAPAGALQDQPTMGGDEVRGMIHRITDLAIDVTAAGHYVADVEFHGHAVEFDLITLPVGHGYGDPGMYKRRLYLDWIDSPEIHARHGKSAGEAKDEALVALSELITHLEALLAEGPADNQEGQPS